MAKRAITGDYEEEWLRGDAHDRRGRKAGWGNGAARVGLGREGL